MLTELHIENLGVIERADLRLGAGLTALTGETGAGKTMLVEAIELLVGGRADATIVRTGAAEARVDGRSSSTATRRARAVTRGPRRRAVAGVRQRAPGDRGHAGRAHRRRGRPARPARPPEPALGGVAQRAALDAFGAIDLAPLRAARARLTEIDAELAALGGDEKARAREIDLLRFQVDELDAAAIDDADEDEQLANEETLLADAVAHREAAQTAIEALRGDGGAAEALATALARARRTPAVRADRRPPGGRAPPSSTTSPPTCAPKAKGSRRTRSGWRRSANAGSS